MSRKRKISIIILSILIFLTLSFIWGNSTVPKVASGQGSSSVFQKFIKPITDFLFGKDNFTHAHFRKTIHAAEFFILSCEIVGLYILINKLKGINYFIIFIFGILVAIIDELIQLISNRGAMVTDVLIDCFGYFLGALLFYFAVYIYKKTKSKRKINQKN